MARNPQSKEAKSKVQGKIEQAIGPTYQGISRRPDWRVTLDRNVCVFMTYSKSSQLFYDLNEGDLSAWLEYPRSFVAFVMGTADDVLIVPVGELEKQLTSKHYPAEGGNYKLHIEGYSGKLFFRELSGFELSAYRNNYEQLKGGKTAS